MPRRKKPREKISQDKKKDFSLKQRLIEKRKAKRATNKLITITLISFILSFVLALIIILLIKEIKIGIAIALLIPSLILSYCYPRQALWFFLIYMPFSGTITYWIGNGNILFQLSKDIFYLPALFALIQECRRQKKPIVVNKKLLFSLSLLITLSLMTLVLVNGTQQVILPYCSDLSNYNQFLRNPDGSYLINAVTNSLIRTPCKEGSPFLQGILGLKIFLGYVPLIFCAYYLIEDEKKLVFLGRLLVVLAIICCTLGLIQYGMLVTGICQGMRGASGEDLFKASLDAKCFVGGSLLYSPSQGQIRLPGTFVSPWHWGWFLIGNSFITFTIAFNDKSFFWRNLSLFSLALVLISSVIAGQRLALVVVPIFLVILLVFTGYIVNLKKFLPFAIALTLILSIVVITKPSIVQQRVDSFVQRWNTAPPHVFVQQQVSYAIREQRGLLGRGLGKATNSTRMFGSTVLLETYHPKLLYELGYLGLISFLIFVTSIVIVTFNSYKSLKNPTLRGFGSSIWLFVLIMSYFPYWYPLDTDPVAVYYWFFVGILLKLPSMELLITHDD